MSLLLILGSALVVMVQQHVTFVSVASRQSFLAKEAPKIGALLGRILSQADHYFIYESREGLLSGQPPVVENGGAVRLFFKAPNNTTVERVITTETTSNGVALRFYTPTLDGTEISWTICSRLNGATFSADEGILMVTLQGPSGEEITYCGSPR